MDPATIVIAVCAFLGVLFIVLIVAAIQDARDHARWAAATDWRAEIREREARRQADLETAARANEAADSIGGMP